MGVRSGGQFVAPAIVVDVADRMPSSGRLGVYLRVRGYSFFTVGVALGDWEKLTWWPDGYSVLTPLSGDYVDHLLFSDPATEPYQWDRYEDRPLLIALFPQIDPEQGVIELFELDCVVPFVVPL